MANTYVKIASVTGTGASGVLTFSSIPATYTDLLVKFSLRSDTTGNTTATIKLNTVSPTEINVQGSGAAASSNTNTSLIINAAGSTALVYSSGEFYLPNYTSSVAKSASSDVVEENNATSARSQLSAYLYSTVTSAVTSLSITDNFGNWTNLSTAYLYGILKS
jgi:hypothetical protein